jgi:Cupin domain
VAARVRRGEGSAGDEAALLKTLAAEGWAGGYGWGNGPGERYPEHSHDYDKALYCVRGEVVFHTADGALPLRPGDRLDLDRGTAHSAVVGPQGVRCVEAHRRNPGV